MAKDKTGRPDEVLEAGGILDRIVDARAKRLRESKLLKPAEEIASRALDSISRRAGLSFANALLKRGGVKIIAEVKRKSPSKGIIRAPFDPVVIATGYSQSGAAALSVLTEEDFFGGSLDHLRAVREHVKLPLLRKDFVFDEYQVYEAALAGADAVLLITAILSDELLSRLIKLSREIKVDALVEVHTRGEMERAERAGARLIGVNNRDLTTFNVDLETSLRLAPLAPRDAVLVSESGISAGEDVRLLRSAGYHALLVGERFMRAEDPGMALASLIEDAEKQ